MKLLIAPIILMVVLSGCAIVPQSQVSQPWVRLLRSQHALELGKSVRIEVVGKTDPLLGSELIASDIIKSTLSQLISRRGFTIAGGNYDYTLKMTYGTIREDKMKISSMVSSTNSQANAMSTTTGAGASTGLGVSVARAISAMASKNTLYSSQSINESKSFTHTISLELFNREGVIVWKGESTWDSEELNIIKRIVPALQLILSDLPSDSKFAPEIMEIKETHVKNYYRLECKEYKFVCPALPYSIQFNDPYVVKGAEIKIPVEVANVNALAAYVDLIQTAEYALPSGDEDDWKDPLDVSLWKQVTLGGQYLLGPEKKPVNVIIRLSGKIDGYYINECKLATEEEFAKYVEKINKWRQALRNYYDVFRN